VIFCPWTRTLGQCHPLALLTTPSQAPLVAVPGQMSWAQTGEVLESYQETHWQGHGQISVSGTLILWLMLIRTRKLDDTTDVGTNSGSDSRYEQADDELGSVDEGAV